MARPIIKPIEHDPKKQSTLSMKTSSWDMADKYVKYYNDSHELSVDKAVVLEELLLFAMRKDKDFQKKYKDNEITLDDLSQSPAAPSTSDLSSQGME